MKKDLSDERLAHSSWLSAMSEELRARNEEIGLRNLTLKT